MRFVYKAKKGPKEMVQGVVEAPSQDVAVTKLRQSGLVPVMVRQEKGQISMRKSKISIDPGQIFKSGVTRKDIHDLTKKLKVLIKSQEPILGSLLFIEEETTKQAMKDLIRSLISSIREGAPISEALSAYPEHFPPLYISIIKAGEASGKLDHSMEQITAYMDNEKQLTQKVISSLAYPLVMIGVGILTVIFMLSFVVPKLNVLFEDFAGELPAITKIMLASSGFLSSYWILLVILAVMTAGILVYTKGAPWQKTFIEGLKRRTPIVKTILHYQSLSRFSGGLSILISSGVSMLHAVKTAAPLLSDETAIMQLEEAYREIVGGAQLASTFKKHCKFLPDMFIKMVSIGEASGRLDEILGDISRTYADEVETSTRIVTSLIEPLAILVIGGILSIMVIAILLPIFEMSTFIN